MTFYEILETLLIGPLKLIFEIIFEYAYGLVGHPALAIVFLSLIMNILVLPLYRRADVMQEQTRDREAQLKDGVAHIKKTFTGDERMMILQTYYRQNHYKPTDALRGTVSLLLEIPFFMAAYQFLSRLEILQGVSMGPIADLSAPDGLLVIGGVAINLLPIVMTLVNVISSTLYLKGFPWKTKIQLYAMALFFLVFLYSSPSCLVFYWTLNNVFSLIKTIFYKLKNPQKVLRYLTAAVGVAIFVFGWVVYQTVSLKRRIFFALVGLAMLVPLFWPALKKKARLSEKARAARPNRRLFLCGAVFLTVLIGLLIPSVFIAASPQEYVDITYFHNPLWYIARSACLAAGTFLVWMRVFYWLASEKGKVFFERLVWIACGAAVVNYMFFGTDLGVISASLKYEGGMNFTLWQQLVNWAVLAVLAVGMYVVVRKWSRAATAVLAVSALALAGMTGANLVTIKKSIDEIVKSTDVIAKSTDEVACQQNVELPKFQLSKTGKNVVVLMLDRAVGEYIPYIFHEKPELTAQFDGFTFYENTISFGGSTNFGAPALLGGYEYTPVEMNKRSAEPLVAKHNEALKVMPRIFSENGYDVTVCDPVYANYRFIPDLSIFDDCPGVKAYISKGQFGDVKQKEEVIQNNYRNFFCFSVMKTLPLTLQKTVYNNGNYHQIAGSNVRQIVYGLSAATGMSSGFMESYSVLENLPAMTNISDVTTNTYFFMDNETTHNPMLLREPDYTPALMVDNAAYDAEHADRFTVNGRQMHVKTADQMIHYHANMAAMIQLGNWFDYLRENGVYDNTKIILVSDHGWKMGASEDLMMPNDAGEAVDVGLFYPLLMVKDFNAEGFTTSGEFMTNADVPTLAMKDLIENPVNPFTGKSINSDEKFAHDQFIIRSKEWVTDKNNGTTFLPSAWASVKENLWDAGNWTFYEEEIVLDENAAP